MLLCLLVGFFQLYIVTSQITFQAGYLPFYISQSKTFHQDLLLVFYLILFFDQMKLMVLQCTVEILMPRKIVTMIIFESYYLYKWHIFKKPNRITVCDHIHILIIVPRKLKQEDCHFHTRLDCLVRPDCFFERNTQYPQYRLKTKQLLTPQKVDCVSFTSKIVIIPTFNLSI